jgi:hypothetical protein
MTKVFSATYLTYGDIDAMWSDHDRHDLFCAMTQPNGVLFSTLEAAKAWVVERHAEEMEFCEVSEADQLPMVEDVTPSDDAGKGWVWGCTWPDSSDSVEVAAWARIHEVEVN